MTGHYNDVDMMILRRWDEVMALREPYDDLLDHMRDTIEPVCEKVAEWLESERYEYSYDVKDPSISAWKPAWGRKNDGFITLVISEFAPLGYGRVRAETPYLWLMTGELERLKMKEATRIQFARDLKSTLGSAASSWEHEDADEASEPLGRYCSDFSDTKRVDLMTHPSKLVDFLKEGFAALFELAPAIDATLAKYREAK
jgi:hypothetical protein